MVPFAQSDQFWCRTRTLGHHGQVHHLADHGVVLVVAVEEGAVEEAAVGARVIEGDIEQVDGGVLDVVAPLASVPVDALQKLLVFDGGAIVVGVDLRARESLTQSCPSVALSVGNIERPPAGDSRGQSRPLL